MTSKPHRPAVTQVRIKPSRLPDEVRARLARVAQRGEEEFARLADEQRGKDPRRARLADVLQQLCSLTLVALVDLASAEMREESQRARAQRAENKLAEAEAELNRLEFAADEPTVARPEVTQTNLKACRPTRQHSVTSPGFR